MTEAEKRLWRGLRELGVPVRFRRQHPVGMFVVDFAFPAAKLAIELDGGQHATQESQDDARSMEIAAHGYRVIRFWNGEVMENLAGVLETICRELTISLSAPGGGAGSLAKRRAVGMGADLGPQAGIERADAAAVVFVHGRIVALDGLRRGRLGRGDLSKGGIATLEQHLVAGNRSGAVDIDARLLGGHLGIQIGELPVDGGERLGLRILVPRQRRRCRMQTYARIDLRRLARERDRDLRLGPAERRANKHAKAKNRGLTTAG